METMEVVDLDNKEGQNDGGHSGDVEDHNVERNAELSINGDVDGVHTNVDAEDVHIEDGQDDSYIENRHSKVNGESNQQLTTTSNKVTGETNKPREEEIYINGNSNNNNSNILISEQIQTMHHRQSFSDDMYVVLSADVGDRTVRDLQKRHVVDRRRVVEKERQRLAQLRHKNKAAAIIQRNWRK